MRVIPTSLHGVIDYLTAILLIASPWLFGFYNGGAETYVPIAVGAIILIQALMTKNETGVMKVLSMPAHLVSDLVIGLVLAMSPWVFDFDELVTTPHLVLGIMIIALGVMTRMGTPAESY